MKFTTFFYRKRPQLYYRLRELSLIGDFVSEVKLEISLGKDLNEAFNNAVSLYSKALGLTQSKKEIWSSNLSQFEPEELAFLNEMQEVYDKMGLKWCVSAIPHNCDDSRFSKILQKTFGVPREYINKPKTGKKPELKKSLTDILEETGISNLYNLS